MFVRGRDGLCHLPAAILLTVAWVEAAAVAERECRRPQGGALGNEQAEVAAPAPV